MISKTLFLLASSAALATAHSLGDASVAGLGQAKVLLADTPVLHQYDPMAANKKYALGPSQHHHHPVGPSQYHHHTGATTHTLALTRGKSQATDNPTLAMTRGQQGSDSSSSSSSSVTLSLGRVNPKFTSMPEGHLKSPDDSGNDNNNNNGHPAPSKSYHPAGASQHHHHPSGPSQYHHSKPEKHNPYYGSTPDKMHYNNGDSSKDNSSKDNEGSSNPKNPYYGSTPEKMHYNNGGASSDAGKNNPKVHHGSGASSYAPYVEGGNGDNAGSQAGSHGGASSAGSWNSNNNSDMSNNSGNPATSDSSNSNDNGENGKVPSQGLGASASARARMAEKSKHEGKYALYGQAAANSCGLDEQMPGAEITACPLESGAGWDCLNLASTLESCGGCMSIGEGQDCTMIKGAESVGCVHGKCIIGTCEKGFYLDSDKGECVAN